MKALRTLAIASAAAIALGGCTKPESGSQLGAAEGARASLTVKGSDTMVQLAQSWAQEFMKANPNIAVTVTGGGSNTGLAALVNKGTDVANASRQIKPEESDKVRASGGEVKEFVVARDALAIIVHPSNSLEELSMAQLKDIYTGKVTNWKEVGGADMAIVLNSRETSSGTYTFFLEHVLNKEAFASNVLLQPSTSQIVENVSQDNGGIGYVGLGYLSANVKAVKVKRDASSPGIAANVEDVRNGTYPLARPLYEYTVGEPQGAAKIWLDWVLSDAGQAVVEAVGFVPAK